jgi:hypothetical protein
MNDPDREEGDRVPVADEAIPEEFLATRDDCSWERETSDVRIALTMDWVAPHLERLQLLQAIGLDAETDDEFNDLVNEAYDGVRDRLTRQDLVRALMLTVGEKIADTGGEMVASMRRDLRALDRPGAFERFFLS